MAGERVLPGLGLYGFWTPTSDGWMWGAQGMNLDWRELSAIGKLSVISRVAALPTSPADGDIYLLTTGGNANNVAIRDNGAWVYLVPLEGWTAWVADEDKEYVFNGTVWSGLYSNVDIDALLAGLVVVQYAMLLLDQRPSGTNSTNVSAFAWRQTVLNTVVYNEIAGATLVANQVTLPAGVYEFEAEKIAIDSAQTIVRFMNLDDNVELVVGEPCYQTGVNTGAGTSYMHGKFTLAAPKLCEMQYRKAGNYSIYSTGKPAALGSPEVYTSVMIKKVQ